MKKFSRNDALKAQKVVIRGGQFFRAIGLTLLLLSAFMLTSCGGDKGSSPGSGGSDADSSFLVFSITSPASNPAYTNNPADLSLSGTCKTGDSISIAGDLSASTKDCIANTFGFTLPGNGDGTYQYFVSKKDTEDAVAMIPFSLIRDSVRPGMVTITSPTSSPVVSSDETLLIWGTCENDTTVTLAEVDGGGSIITTQSTICAGKEYSFPVSKPGVANYRFTLTQEDLAGNTSLPMDQIWVQDPSVPATPMITAPFSTPFFSNSGPVSLSGTCLSTPAHTVTLKDWVSQSTTDPCTSNAYAFSLPEPAEDGVYTYRVSQTDNLVGLNSAETVFQWIYDTTPPQVPVIISPISPFTSPGPLVISGLCEEGATVYLLSNPGAAVLQSLPCVGGSFSFTVTEVSDGNYQFDISQTDKAGNDSPGIASFSWHRNSASTPPPILTFPGSNPFLSNGNTLALIGQCQEGFTVTLSGDIGDTTTCGGGFFSFTMNKSGEGTDGSYTLNVVQDDGLGGTVSDPVTLIWNRDITPPDLTVTGFPPNPNPSRENRFEFGSSEADSIFECNLDNSGFTTCTAPVIYFDLANGPPHTLEIRAKDLVGNVTPPKSFNWTQNAHHTVALYHLDDTDPLADSSLYTAGFETPLNADLPSAPGVAGMAEGRLFNGTTDFMSSPDNPKHAAFRSVMTVEAFVKFNSLPSKNMRMVIAGKTDGAIDQGWEFGLKSQGGSGSYTLYFDGSLDGVNTVTTKSARLNGVNSGQFYHVAVSWNKGEITFFFNGEPIGIKTLGSVGSASLWPSAEPLRLGSSNGAGNFLDGVMDEVRISQVVRYTSGFTPPKVPFIAD